MKVIKYAAELVRGDLRAVAEKEFAAAKKAGLDEILKARKEASTGKSSEAEEVKAPPKEVVTSQIAGIEIMDLEDGVQALWKVGIYAESGMGCTGPIILVNESKTEDAVAELKKAKFIG